MNQLMCILFIGILPFFFQTHNSSANMAEGPIFVTEIMAADNEFLPDEDNEYPDWIELYHAGMKPVDLEGWYITDTANDLTKWAFPNLVMQPGEYRILFASGKDRRNSTAPLHTNFSLRSEGEFLAIVKSDGKTISHAYNPSYDTQDVPYHGTSYGLYHPNVSLIHTKSTFKYHIPHDSSNENQWMGIGFVDSSWQDGQGWIGYGTLPGRFTVTVFRSTIPIQTLNEALAVMRNSSRQLGKTTETVSVINYKDNLSVEGHYGQNNPFPGQRANENVDDFVVRATATLIIPQSGYWTFGTNSDDGVRLRIGGQTVIMDSSTHGPEDRFGQIELEAGEHDLELYYFENTGGAELELFAAAGQLEEFDPSRFQLVGDSSHGGISLAGFITSMQTNLEESMRGMQSTVYLRFPFHIESLSERMTMKLRIQYNDGFAAFLNGQPLVKRNAPELLQWNSQATTARTLSHSSRFEEFVLNTESVRQGQNVLAIQGLNVNADDSNFWIRPELNVSYLEPTKSQYFLIPSPGSPNPNGVIGFLEPPTFSHQRGFYETPFSLSLLTDIPNAIIRYATEGSDPQGIDGIIYENPIDIRATSIIRAAVFLPDYAPSVSVTHTYIFLEDVIQQTNSPDLPDRWGNNVLADYEMNPDIVNHPDYSNTIIEDFQSIPSISIVMDSNDLFGRSQGIYVNPEQKGIAWERAGSTEWIDPQKQEGFQINNGIRIQGGYSRIPDRRKHSFRLLFKRDYGPPKLHFSLFDHLAVDEFDTIVLRGNYNYTWHAGEGGFGSTIGHAEYIRDEFSRRTQLDLGQPASHGTYVHLYLNGLYWGVYNVCERPDDSFSAAYFGGDKDEYDIITGGSRGISTTQVKAGNKEAWNEIMRLAQAGHFEQPENYQAIQQYVDVENLIDYMLLIFYTGNRDAPTIIGGNGTPWNFYTSRLRKPGAGLKTFVWDAEWCLEEPDRNVVNFHRGRDNPALIFQQLRSNPEFLMKVADRAHKHFFNQGAMTAGKSMERYSMLAEKIRQAIVGESARWGDARGGRPKTRNEDWQNEINRLLTTYFPVRTEIVIQQLKDSNLYPSVEAPVFNHAGGTVNSGFPLTMRSEKIVEISTPLIAMASTWRYHQSGNALSAAWKNPDYDDANWLSGEALFYVENSRLPATKKTPLDLGRTTYYFRNRFTLDTGLDLEQTTINLETILDDGAVIYLNGVELFRIGMPDGPIQYSDYANRTVSNAVLEGPFSLPGTLLRNGDNVIAVEVHQTNANSSDIVFGLKLDAVTTNKKNPIVLPIYYTTDGSDPRLDGGTLNPSAFRYEQPIEIYDNVHIRARALDGNTWSALNEISLSTEIPIQDVATLREFLRVSEVMYNPIGGGQFEFLELYNSSSILPIRLDGLAFTRGIQLEFPAETIIPPDGYLLLSKVGTTAERMAFQAHYYIDDTIPILAPYAGQLANEGERITLSSLPTGEEILSFAYSDNRGWPIQADGAGHSLVPISTVMELSDQSVLNYGGNWQASFAIGGSPGRKDPESQDSVRINEFLASTQFNDHQFPEYDSNDWIELYNHSSEPVEFKQWYLSDDADDLKKWLIPTVQIPAFGFMSFDEISGFHNPLDAGFGLDNDGEQIFLSYLPGIFGEDRVVDAVQFKAQERNLSKGRYRDGEKYWYQMNPTRESHNQAHPLSILIDEIMYAPSETMAHPDEVDMYEYIELYNQTNESVDLGDPNQPFRLEGGVDYAFTPGTILPDKGRLLVVGFNPNDIQMKTTFLDYYQIREPSIRLVGPYQGKLSNEGERIAFEKARALNSAGLPASWIIKDEVIYFTKFPWTSVPLKSGMVLQRITKNVSGNDPMNWYGEKPSPGRAIEEETEVRDWTIY